MYLQEDLMTETSFFQLIINLQSWNDPIQKNLFSTKLCIYIELEEQEDLGIEVLLFHFLPKPNNIWLKLFKNHINVNANLYHQ